MLKLADVGSDREILGFVCFQTHETCGDGPRDGPYRHMDSRLDLPLDRPIAGK